MRASWWLSCVVALSLAGCGGGALASESDLRPLVEALCRASAEGRIDSVYDEISPFLKATTSRATWNEIFDTAAHAYGPCRVAKVGGVSNLVSPQVGKYAELETVLEFGREKMDFTVRFNRCGGRWCIMEFDLTLQDATRTPDDAGLFARSRVVAETVLGGDGEALWALFPPQLQAIRVKDDILKHAAALHAACAPAEIQAPQVSENPSESFRRVAIRIRCPERIVELQLKLQFILGAWLLMDYDALDLTHPTPATP